MPQGPPPSPRLLLLLLLLLPLRTFHRLSYSGSASCPENACLSSNPLAHIFFLLALCIAPIVGKGHQKSNIYRVSFEERG
jgi:hypothetical protein